MGFRIQPRQQVAEGLRFAVIGPDGFGLPLRLLTQDEAERIAAMLNNYAEEQITTEDPEECRTLRS